MKSYTTFTEALADFRLSGGAMNFYDGVFQVGDLEEIAEVVTGTAKEATAEALRVGGLSDEQIAAELADWVEPTPTPHHGAA